MLCCKICINSPAIYIYIYIYIYPTTAGNCKKYMNSPAIYIYLYISHNSPNWQDIYEFTCNIYMYIDTSGTMLVYLWGVGRQERQQRQTESYGREPWSGGVRTSPGVLQESLASGRLVLALGISKIVSDVSHNSPNLQDIYEFPCNIYIYIYVLQQLEHARYG